MKDGELRAGERRVPVRELRRDENGNLVEVELGPEYYMIEREDGGGVGCKVSYAMLELLLEEGKNGGQLVVSKEKG